MQARVDWDLIIFGTQVIKKKRPGRPVFPDYLSVSYDYALMVLMHLYISKQAKLFFLLNCGKNNDLPSWFEPYNFFSFLFLKLLAWKISITVDGSQM